MTTHLSTLKSDADRSDSGTESTYLSIEGIRRHALHIVVYQGRFSFGNSGTCFGQFLAWLLVCKSPRLCPLAQCQRYLEMRARWHLVQSPSVVLQLRHNVPRAGSMQMNGGNHIPDPGRRR